MMSMTTFDHFAYGSNLSVRRLRARCPSATRVAVGFVRCCQLRFHKVGLDGTGKANAFWTGNLNDCVWGVVYRCRRDERYELDRCESLGDGYQEFAVAVQAGASVLNTFLYQAMPDRIDSSLRPAAWYHGHVIRGAQEHGLPDHYQQMIAAFPALPDHPNWKV